MTALRIIGKTIPIEFRVKSRLLIKIAQNIIPLAPLVSNPCVAFVDSQSFVEFWHILPPLMLSATNESGFNPSDSVFFLCFIMSFFAPQTRHILYWTL